MSRLRRFLNIYYIGCVIEEEKRIGQKSICSYICDSLEKSHTQAINLM